MTDHPPGPLVDEDPIEPADNRMMSPALRFSPHDISDIAARYRYSAGDASLLEMRPEVKKRGWLCLAELHEVAKWKAPRSAGHVRKNSEAYVAEITGFALAARCERSRIESLTLLDGVGWPMASVILHVFHADPYPILDSRALWSVSLPVPAQYSFAFWQRYVEFCRQIAATAGVDMRGGSSPVAVLEREPTERVGASARAG